jgi:hypothetical protein
MEIQDRPIDLPYSQALPMLEKSLRGYLMHWKRVKIGVTSRPDLRSKQHEQEGWERMYVVYEAFRADLARSMERALISSVHSWKFSIGVENQAMGGEGVKDHDSNYVYVIVADKRSNT